MQIDKDELLNQAKELLKDEVTQIAFDTWFKTLEIVEMTDSNIVLQTNSAYNQELLEARYGDLILNTFKYITNRDWTISIVVDEAPYRPYSRCRCIGVGGCSAEQSYRQNRNAHICR